MRTQKLRVERTAEPFVESKNLQKSDLSTLNYQLSTFFQ